MSQPKFQVLPGGDDSSQGTEIIGLRKMNALLNRMQLASMAGYQFGGKRKLYEVFGYPVNLQDKDFAIRYIRQDIAARIVDAPPEASWANHPTIRVPGDTAAYFDKIAWDDDIDLWNVMKDGDRFSRMNRFSIVLFGFPGALDKPAPAGAKMLYARAIGSRHVSSIQLESDPQSPRFGKPKMYKVQLHQTMPSTSTIVTPSSTASATRDVDIHWTRTIHIVESPLEDQIYGIPTMEKISNLLDDLLKVVGGTAETYWLTANRGIQADVDKEMELDPGQAAELGDQIEEYSHQLRRVLRTRGVKLNVLTSETPSPKEPFEMLISLLSGTTGIPRRILLGSEAGQLASEQDRANWSERIEERNMSHVEPRILRPTIRLLQRQGLIGTGQLEVKWPEVFRLSPLERATVMASKARAVGNFSRQTGNKTPMQITSRVEARELMDLEGDLPENELFNAGDPDFTSGEEGTQTDANSNPPGESA